MMSKPATHSSTASASASGGGSKIPRAASHAPTGATESAGAGKKGVQGGKRVVSGGRKKIGMATGGGREARGMLNNGGGADEPERVGQHLRLRFARAPLLRLVEHGREPVIHAQIDQSPRVLRLVEIEAPPQREFLAERKQRVAHEPRAHIFFQHGIVAENRA